MAAQARAVPRLTIFTPMNSSSAASASIGIRLSADANEIVAISTHTPWSTVDQRLRARPDVRGRADDHAETGRPPRPPETTLATPWAHSSRSRSARGPSCMRSAATQVSSDSTPASTATSRIEAAMACQSPVGRIGPASWLSPLARSTSVNRQPASAAVTVAMASAASGAGTNRTLGMRSHTSSTPIVSRPIMTASPWSVATWAGTSIRLSSADRCGLPPSTMWSCESAMTTPTPASMPWMTAGETPRAALATRNAPRMICSSPAASVMAQVARQPYTWTRSATTSDRSRGGAADLDDGAAQRARDDAADDRRHQPGRDRRPGRDRDAQ